MLILGLKRIAVKQYPVGTEIHNIELKPGKGAQLVRAAGNSAQLMARKENMLDKTSFGEVEWLVLSAKHPLDRLAT